jgi:hypothetical protein
MVVLLKALRANFLNTAGGFSIQYSISCAAERAEIFVGMRFWHPHCWFDWHVSVVAIRLHTHLAIKLQCVRVMPMLDGRK